MLQKAWFLKGQNPSCSINWTKMKGNVLGAVDVNNGYEFFAKRKEKVNSETFIEFIHDLIDEFGEFILIMDNAPWHTSKKVNPVLDELSDIISVHFLPKYSPDLNPVELFWRVAKSRLSNRLFKTKNQFHKAVEKAVSDITIGVNKLHYLTD